MISTSAHSRQILQQGFLQKTPYENARLTPLAGDASGRVYYRLEDPTTKQTAVLMDAAPEIGQEVSRFAEVAQYLNDCALTAPIIYKIDPKNGFLLLEDFGDNLFDQMCLHSPAKEIQLYESAVLALAHLATCKTLPQAHDFRPQMSDISATVFEWYVEPIAKVRVDSDRETCIQMLDELIHNLSTQQCTMLRDFHAQNLIWLPNRTENQRVGLLDFQDAMIGPLVYDLVSLVTDCRRPISNELKEHCKRLFQRQLRLDQDAFERDFAICSVQRNLRILMIFSRMSLHFKKPHYVDFIPEVWRHLQQDLQHPDLVNLKEFLDTALPQPTHTNLKVLKDKCGTYPLLP